MGADQENEQPPAIRPWLRPVAFVLLALIAIAIVGITIPAMFYDWVHFHRIDLGNLTPIAALAFLGAIIGYALKTGRAPGKYGRSIGMTDRVPTGESERK